MTVSALDSYHSMPTGPKPRVIAAEATGTDRQRLRALSQLHGATARPSDRRLARPLRMPAAYGSG